MLLFRFAVLMPLLLATANPHKVRELRAILEPLLGPMGLSIVSLDEARLADGRPASSLPEPVEDGDTFEDNARIKAVAYARATGVACLADDSGLEVDALMGEPGVDSAYFAHGREKGPGVPRAERDAANNARLLRVLQGQSDSRRTARFVCAMCLASPSGEVLAAARGTFEGRIGREPKGANGFGYDPLLTLEDGRTSAELSDEEKNARSHRGAAARAMAQGIAVLARAGRLK